MKILNFKQLLIATDVARKHCEKIDSRESFANVLYCNGDGISSHVLALKIYNSIGETEYTDEEINLIKKYADSCCKPFFIDALNCAIENQVVELIEKIEK